jgi:uncharacterized protein DUF2188
MRVPASRTWLVSRRGREWIVRRRDASRAESMHATLEAAVERGTALARRYGGVLRVTGADGKTNELDLTGER